MSRTIRKAMKAAIRHGIDPYNSLDRMAVEAGKIERRRLRYQAERWAAGDDVWEDFGLPIFLRRQAD